MKKVNRREFLDGASKLLITSLVSAHLPYLRAQQEKASIAKKMIHIHLDDGAHHLLGLDPLIIEKLANRELDPVKRDDTTFMPMYDDKDLIQTKHFLLGPAAANLARHSQDFSIVAGIQGISISHSENARFNMTGDEDGRESLLVEEAYSQLQTGILGIGLSSRNSDMVRSRSIQLNQIGGVQRVSEDSQKLSLQYKPDSSVVQQMIGIQKRLTDYEKVRSKLVSGYPVSNRMFNSIPVHEVVASMKLDLSNFNFISISNGLDTHFGHEQHKDRLGEMLSSIATLIDMLKKTEGSVKNQSLFEETLILVTTDFGRTSYNQNGQGNGFGTDHNPRNTTFMLSGGLIRGGLKIGESTIIGTERSGGRRTTLTGLPVHWENKQAVSYKDFIGLTKEHGLSTLGKNVSFVFPGHVMATICSALEIEKSAKIRRYQPIKELLKNG